MRTDIDASIIAKTSNRLQNDANNSAPRLSLVISRKEMFLDDFLFTERRRVRRTTLNSITDVGIAICHPRRGKEDESIWITYVKSGKVYLRRSNMTGDVTDMDWDEFDIGAPNGTKCDIAFVATATTSRQGDAEYVTDKRPIVFFLDNDLVKYVRTTDPYHNVHTVFSTAVKDFSVRQTPLGLAVFYVKTSSQTTVNYRLYNAGTSQWGAENTVSSTMSATIERLSTFNIPDGFGIQAYAGGKLYRIVSDSSLSFGSWFDIADANGTGAIVEYPDGQREAFFDADIAEATGEPGGFCYSKGGEGWFFNAGNQLNDKHYSVIEFDHTNVGSVYFVTLYHGAVDDIVYFIRYVYSKDVSSYTANVEKILQVDNPISQINASLMNVDDSLYTSDGTIFSPSSMMRLGVSYGDSDIVDLGLGFIDQVTFGYGEKYVSISGRNRTGVYLRDQNFEEDTEFVDTPSLIVDSIMEMFGINDYECDNSADGTQGEPNIVTLVVEAGTTGMQALETLNDLLTNDAAGKKWAFEELPSGKIIIGYDEFRATFIAKSNYVFNGHRDVFARTVDRSIDGVYTKVRCTGSTVKGKEISYTYNVTNFRFWDAGENRIYHAPHVDGITKSELKKYAKALAKQLKYIGRIITYRMNLKPQLVIGDVAKITYGQEDGEEERVGSITEIRHILGSKEGYFTEFTVTSGGDITDVSPTVVYVADKSATGTNRQKRVSDYLGGNGKGGTTNISSTIINGDSVNLPELIRNLGMRVLNEPTSVKAEYDSTNNTVKLKWTDPDDLTDLAPVPCEWAGTVVVRNENGNPLNPYDGVLITRSTTRNAYSAEWLVDNNNIVKGTTYYYAIMPYHVAIDDEQNPINWYRWTKVISITAGSDLEPAVITGVSVDGTSVSLTLSIPAMASGSYEAITLVAKKDGTPLNVEDGDAFVSLTSSSTSAQFSGLDEQSTYYFVIFSEDDQGNVAVSDARSATTGRNEGYNFAYTGGIQTFTAPKTGIYQLETWGAQGGNAEDSENELTARGGYGAYAKGEVLLVQGETIYIGVGGQSGYNGGGTQPQNMLRVMFEGSPTNLAQISDQSIITSEIKNATSFTRIRPSYYDTSEQLSYLSSNGDIFYDQDRALVYSEEDTYKLVDNDYIEVGFGKVPYRYSGKQYYGAYVYNKVAQTFGNVYGFERNVTEQNWTRKYYVAVVIDHVYKRAYMLFGSNLRNFNYASNGWLCDLYGGVVNGVDYIYESFKDREV